MTENSATLKWAEPNDTGNCDITGYHLEKKEANRTKWNKVSLRKNCRDQRFTHLVEIRSNMTFCG